MLYPLNFLPIYKEMIWGGQKMKSIFKRVLPYEHTGESWDISCRPNEMGVVANGPCAGESFFDVISKPNRQLWLGKNLSEDKAFPLLVKLVDANDYLSVQVHPNDNAVRRLEPENPDGCKNEVWYILDAPEDANLIIGLRDGVSKSDFEKALKSSSCDGGSAVMDCLNKLRIKPGDVVFIPAGLIHAITKGVMVAEIQQNSDITYRVFDYNRLGFDGKPRQLHIDKALESADFCGKLKKSAVRGLDAYEQTFYICNKYFAIISRTLNEASESSDPKKFFIYTCVEGSCTFTTEPGFETAAIAGDSIFIPAALGPYAIASNQSQPCKLIKSFVPDPWDDFINPLLSAGYSLEDIKAGTSLDNEIAADMKSKL
ncbi:MAG: class I mannose-6-phosphate isomerase [Clostridiales bacterium]|nr:class I mannose-6-phosphate isomerase [Clostridiales bacterium]